MQLAFRLECPHCRWGHPWRDRYVNQGWVLLRCEHCNRGFYARIRVTGVEVETSRERPELPAKAGRESRHNT